MASWMWGVDIIEALARCGALTASEICDQTGIERASAYRVLEQLEAQGWVVGGSRPKKYALGTRVAETGMPAVRRLPGRAVLLPFLAELSEAIGRHAQLTFYQRGGRVFSSDRADVIAGRVVVQALFVSTRAALTSSGKVLLAYQDASELDAVAARGLKRLTEFTLVTADEIRASVADARSRGYGRVDREFDLNQSGFA
ncbi:MAG: helix-turn-helix domain-containing protein, partial [Thermomicrobiales bacterium]|nr:helix-turn-helix domain-containing protein [Thermomicrobiales bacterium]